jgi:UDP-N-acetyl-D-mannosaminuronic acid dehydrogenase
MIGQTRKIVVMGLGYIGLPTASMLATKGYHVLGVDVRKEIVDTINSGGIHIVERDLDILVKSAVKSGQLKASLTPEEADVFILAVPTPFKNDISGLGAVPKMPDVSYIKAATKAIIPFLRENNLIILESTSPVGTTEKIYAYICADRPEIADKIFVAHCPERVLPGQILRELVDNDRIIGGISRLAAEKAKELYSSFCSGNIYLTDSRTAEMAKLVENSYRDVNIAFANELSLICERLDINVWELIELANKHPRVKILKPGPGVGGHCIAVDPWFIVAAVPEEAKLISKAREVNDSLPDWVVARVIARADRFKNPVIGCLGLAFKADIDDLRESPALEITRKLISSGVGEIMACEPNVKNGEFSEFRLYDLDEILKRADIIVLLVDHKGFKSVDRDILKEKVVIDTRGVWR